MLLSELERSELTSVGLKRYLMAWQQAWRGGAPFRTRFIPPPTRTVRLTAMANHLASLLAQAEGSELSYLNFAQLLAEHERNECTHSRITRHL